MMGVRLAAVIGLVVVLLTCATIAQSGAADAGVIIADLQCAGDVVVKRASGEEVAAYVGLQLFPKDTVSATSPAVLTLFDDGAGTTTQDVAPGTPFVVGAAATAKRELVAGLTSSISDLFGTADQAHKRDRDVGAVQAGAVIARLPVTDGGGGALAPEAGKDGAEPASPKQELMAPQAPAPKPAVAGAKSNAFSAPETLQAPAPLPSPAVGAVGVPQDAAPEPASAPGASTLESAPAEAQVAKEAKQSAPGAAMSDELDLEPPAREDEGAVQSDKLKSLDSRSSVTERVASRKKEAAPAVVAQLEGLTWRHPLARAKVVTMAEKVPPLGATAVSGQTTLTAGGAAIGSLDQTLVDGAKVRLKAAPASGAGWEIEMAVVSEAEWADVKRRAAEIARSRLPNRPLLVANLLEARGFLLMSYQLRLRAMRGMERAGRADGLMRSLWTTVGQQALLLGDWTTASGMAARARKK